MASTARRVRLDPMTGAEYDAYLDEAVREYGEQKTLSGEWTAAEARERSAADHARLLPDGLHSPGQYLFTVRDPDSGSDEPVAVLWLALRIKAERIEGYVYDISVSEAKRGQGYGRATMEAAIEEARGLGAETVGLHVFGHNGPARALYTSLGFVETNISMSLEL
jgi:ribosomal protein S18 acetylase RimI-like enzyme